MFHRLYTHKSAESISGLGQGDLWYIYTPSSAAPFLDKLNLANLNSQSHILLKLKELRDYTDEEAMVYRD